MRRICVFVPAATRTGRPGAETTANAHPPATAGVALGARAGRAMLGVSGNNASAAAPPCVPDVPRQRRLAPALLAVESVSWRG
jgi:hypothetical protein